MKVLILAAGYGTRLRPITNFIPKPMLPIAGKPALEHIIQYLKQQGFEELIIAVSHLADQIQEYFGDGEPFGVNITYSYNAEPSGTAGEVWKAREYIDGPFICYYGDIITNLDLHRLVAFHEKKGCIATLALVKNIPLEVGVVKLNGDHLITDFYEKPLIDKPVNAAIYVLEKEILHYIAECDEQRKIDFGYDIFPKLLRDRCVIGGCLFEDNYWNDLGTIRRYQDINKKFTEMNQKNHA